MAEALSRDPQYVLGYSDAEYERLVAQADLFADLTAQVFDKAGLGPGMRVLDIGSGAGDLSLLAARFVGPSGSVVGVERSAESVILARARAAAMGLEQVRFRQGEIGAIELDEPVDALIGRLILTYLPGREDMLHRLMSFVRPGGLVIFQEMEMSLARSTPPCPLFEKCAESIRETFRRASFEVDMGSALLPLFRRLGLVAPQCVLGARVEAEALAPGYVASTVRSLLPMMERLGVATAHDVQIDTLAARLEAEVRGRNAVMVLPPLIGCWARRPM